MNKRGSNFQLGYHKITSSLWGAGKQSTTVYEYPLKSLLTHTHRENGCYNTHRPVDVCTCISTMIFTHLTTVDVVFEVSGQSLVVVIVEMTEKIGGTLWYNSIAKCINCETSSWTVKRENSR